MAKPQAVENEPETEQSREKKPRAPRVKDPGVEAAQALRRARKRMAEIMDQEVRLKARLQELDAERDEQKRIIIDAHKTLAAATGQVGEQGSGS